MLVLAEGAFWSVATKGQRPNERGEGRERFKIIISDVDYKIFGENNN